MAEPKMLTVCLEDGEEPLGFIEINSSTTLAAARDIITGELEDLPEHYRFFVPSPAGGMVKLSLMQETKRMAEAYLPKITIREVPPEGSAPGTLHRTTAATQQHISVPAASITTSTPNHHAQSPVGNNTTTLHDISHRSSSPVPTENNAAVKSAWQPSKPHSDKEKKPFLSNNSTTKEGGHKEDEDIDNLSVRLAVGRKVRPPIDTVLTDPGIDMLWEFYFEKRTVNKVRVDEIPFALYSIVQEKVDPNTDDFRALQALVINLGPLTYGASDDRDEYENPKQVFYKILKTFGPLDGLLTRITSMLKMKEYHGNITSKAAEESVRRQPVGTYLLRLSNSSPGSLALTVRTNETHVHNYLVERTPEFGFVLGKDTFSTIEEVIQRNTKRLRFRTPCKDSPFRRTFDQINIARAYTSFEEVAI